MAGRPAARITDMHVCPMVTPGVPPVPHVGGPIIPTCSPNVITGGLNQARVTDMCTCVGPLDQIIQGSPTVLVNGLQAARIGDTTAHGGVITTGFATVLIGENGTGGSPSIASMSLMDKMLAAIESANLPPAILQQLGDLRLLAGSAIVVSAVLAAIAATGFGAVAEGLAVGLLLTGAFLSGMQIGNGLMALADFVRICQTAQTSDDLNRAGRRFSDGIAAIGVGTVSMLFSLEGAKTLTSAERVANVASRVSAEATAAEPKLTAHMQKLAAENDADLAGLENRLKTPESLGRKLMTEVTSEGIPPEIAASRLSDSVRYTFTADKESLTGTTLNVLQNLQEQGYSINKIKNTWLEPDAPYRGVNVQLVSPEGQPFEVQFHTPESYAVKQQTHPLYEAARATNISDFEKASLFRQQTQMSQRLEKPTSIHLVKPYP